MAKSFKILFFLLGIIALTFQPVYGVSEPVFFDVAAPLAKQQLEPFVKRNRFVKFHPDFLKTVKPEHFQARAKPRLHLNLFDDADFSMVVDRPEIRPKGRTVYSGHFENVPGSMAVFTQGDGIMTGLFFVPGMGTFKILPAENGTHRIMQVDMDNGFQCGMDASHPGLSDPKVEAAMPQEGIPNLVPLNYPAGCEYAQGLVQVDLMVAYTSKALSIVGGTEAMESLLDTIIFYNNLIYFNSGVNVQMRLVYSGLVTYSETGNMYTELSNLGSGVVPGVQTARNAYGADLVCLWVGNPDPIMGLAQMPGYYSVIHAQFPEAVFHEIGHNFGCGHDFAHGGPGVYSYSAGNRFTAQGVQYRTIMAYAPGVYASYFSNPLMDYLGVPTGVTNSTDNARTINQTASVISNAKPPIGQLPIVAITAPSEGDSFTSPLNINLSATASKPGGTIAQVDFYADGQFLGTKTSAPYTFVWSQVPSGSHFISAHAVDNTGGIQFSCPISIFVESNLPTPWVDQDIGFIMQNSIGPQELKYMGVLGSSTYSDGVYIVNGAGVGIAQNITGTEEDSFHFVSQTFCGNGTLIARVTDLQMAFVNFQGGIMFRDKLTPLSPYVMLGVWDSNITFAYRTSPGGNTTRRTGAASVLPLWLKIQKAGNTYLGLTSTDGSSWTTIGTATVAMGTMPQAGLAVTSGEYRFLSSATFDNVSFSMACVPPTPTVTFTKTWTMTPTISPTPMHTSTQTLTPLLTDTPTISPTPTVTLSPTPTSTPTTSFTPVPYNPNCCVSGSSIITSAAGITIPGYSGDGGPATLAQLGSPKNVAASSSGNLYISDLDFAVIRKVSPSGVISTYGGNGTSGYSGDGGPATLAQIWAGRLAVDSEENLYIDNWCNIRKIDKNGIITTFAGNGICGYSGDGGPATLAQIGGTNGSTGLTIDPAGNVYISDFGSNTIRKISTSGIITTIAGGNTGLCIFSGDGGPAIDAILCGPEGLGTDVFGNIYFDDYGNARIRKINTNTGIITTIAGNGSHGFWGDGGSAIQASIGQVDGIAYCRGNIYISDFGNERIRMINSSGIISTIAGNGTLSNTGDGGIAANSTLFDPWAISVDNAGNLYIGTWQARLRKISSGCLPPATFTKTYTPTVTLTFTQTMSFTPTFTLSRTSTFTPTITLTPTISPTFSFTPTGTWYTPTCTFTQQLDAPMPTLTPTETLTPTATPLPPVLYPNPASGPEPAKLHMPLNDPTNSVKIRVYTVAFRKINAWEYNNLPQGVYEFPIELKDEWGTPLANGLYYVVADVNGVRKIFKLLVLR